MIIGVQQDRIVPVTLITDVDLRIENMVFIPARRCGKQYAQQQRQAASGKSSDFTVARSANGRDFTVQRS